MQLNLDAFLNGFKNKDIAYLSRAITLAESKKTEHQNFAKQILEKLYHKTGNAKRIGISGTPGVGKSTFIESFGMNLIQEGLSVAVLAIDPTSNITGGSILGDKTRMQKLSVSDNAYIRPTPSGETLGGVAAKTREAMLFCEAFGFDIIIIETVGVGQSEITVSQMVDFFLLLLQPGGGDDLQGIKRGILEVADLVAINKSDGESLKLATTSALEYSSAIKILHSHKASWKPKVIKCSAISGMGLDQIWKLINEYYQTMTKENKLKDKRDNQLKNWLRNMFYEKVKYELSSNKKMSEMFLKCENDLINRNTSILDATDELFEAFINLGLKK